MDDITINPEDHDEALELKATRQLVRAWETLIIKNTATEKNALGLAKCIDRLCNNDLPASEHQLAKNVNCVMNFRRSFMKSEVPQPHLQQQQLTVNITPALQSEMDEQWGKWGKLGKEQADAST